MRLRSWRLGGWLLVSAVAFPRRAPAQVVQAADLVGSWRGTLEQAGYAGTAPGWLILWPDELWWYTGLRMVPNHGGARWRLAGDTLWLASTGSVGYFYSFIVPRIDSLRHKYGAIGVLDTAIINHRSTLTSAAGYWAFIRDSVATGCFTSDGTCATWVYKVSLQDGQLHLVLLENLSRHPEWAPLRAVFHRDSLVGCGALPGSGAHRDQTPC